MNYRKTLLLTLWIACSASCANAASTVVEEFDVEPLTRYRLSFKADAAGESSWASRIYDKEGLLPYEGVYKYDWQTITSEKKSYLHEFLTPRGGSRLKFSVDHEGAAPTISDVKLEKITGGDLVINGEFSAGLDNYSGWNDHHLAKLVKNDKGKIELKCEPVGYALTDPIPVEPGAAYKYTPGSRPGRVLVYDRDLLRVDWVEGYHPTKNPLLKIPEDAGFIRVEYCDGRTYRPGAVPVIGKLGIELAEKGPGVTEKTFPPYPGEIVLKENSPLPEVRAAREIQHWVRKISGKEMRVLAAPSDKKNMKIFVGKSWAEKLFPKDLDYLKGTDGFAVRRKGKNIYVFGARPGGTLFGAIRLLERNSDLIFARPRREFGTIYSKNPDMTFDEADFSLRPAFTGRKCLNNNAARSDDGIWQGRVGMNSDANYYSRFRRKEMGGTPHSCTNYTATIFQGPDFSFEKCEKDYPEMFALVNGKRQVAPNSFICPTHPLAAKAVAAGLVAAVKKAEKRGEPLDSVGVRVKDGWTVCSCDECMKPIPLPDGTLLKPKAETAKQDQLFFSTRKAVLLNQVAEEFAKTYPNMPIDAEAYIYTSEPPAVPYKPSLIPTFCAYDTCSLRFPILDAENNSPLWARRFGEFLRRNKDDDRQLSMFAYYYPCGFSAVADAVAADWRAMVESGGTHAAHLDGFTPDTDNYQRRGQYQEMWDYQAMERWIITRLMWDPTLDPQALREYYVKRTYGKAAPEMLEFFNLIRKLWEDPKIKCFVNCHTSPASIFDELIVKTGNEKKLRNLLVAAEKKAVDPKSKTLIERMLAVYDRFAGELNRIYVPFVVESTAEWNLADSTFWMQALKLGEFKRVTTWADFRKTPVEHPTDVSIMRDRENLYVRFLAKKAAAEGDRVELVLEAVRKGPKFFFALDRKGKTYNMKNGSPWNCEAWSGKVTDQNDAYVAMFKIPYSVISNLDVDKDEFKFYAKFCRLISNKNEREESALTGYSITRTHYMNYWTALSVNNNTSREQNNH